MFWAHILDTILGLLSLLTFIPALWIAGRIEKPLANALAGLIQSDRGESHRARMAVRLVLAAILVGPLLDLISLVRMLSDLLPSLNWGPRYVGRVSSIWGSISSML